MDDSKDTPSLTTENVPPRDQELNLGTIILGVPHLAPSIADSHDRPSRRAHLRYLGSRFKVSECGSDRPSVGDRPSLFVRGKTAFASMLNVPPSFSYKGHPLSDKVKEVLRKFDVNDDEVLDVEEVTALVEHLLSEENQNKHLRLVILLLVIFTAILLAGTFGLTWAVVAALKDTRLEYGARMVSKQGTLVQIGSAEYAMDGAGLFVPRTHNGSVAPSTTVYVTREDGSLAPTSATNSVRTAVYSGTRIANISSLIRIQSLMELNHMFFTAPSGAELALRVMGVARIPRWESVWGSVVKVVTPVGTIELDDTKVVFEDTMAPLFRDAGFSSAEVGSGRRLLQSPVDETPALAAGTFNYVDASRFTPNTLVWKYDDLGRNMAAVRERGSELADTLNKIVRDSDGTAYSDLLAAWKRYSRAFEKRADSSTEEKMSFDTFQANLQQVAAINTDPNSPYFAGANWYSDLSWDQFETDVLADHAPPSPANMPGRARRAMSRHLLADLPQEVDWRTHGKVTPPRHQGRCGSCWAFAAVALVESAALMANASLPLGALDLSEAHTAFCCAGDRAICAQSNGCKGGTPVDGLAYIKRYGITTEAKAPYNNTIIGNTGIPCPVAAGDQAALANASALVTLDVDPEWIWDHSEYDMLAAVARGPVMAYVNTNAAMQQYAGGVFPAGSCSTHVNHIVLVVGYSQSEKVWIAKNSWGEQWGEGGYYRLPFTGDGPGPCGLYQFAFSLEPRFTNLNLNLAKPVRLSANTTVNGTDANTNTTKVVNAGGDTTNTTRAADSGLESSNTSSLLSASSNSSANVTAQVFLDSDTSSADTNNVTESSASKAADDTSSLSDADSAAANPTISEPTATDNESPPPTTPPPPQHDDNTTTTSTRRSRSTRLV